MMPSILVVEDEPAILELLKVNLADAGYDVQGGRAMPRRRARRSTRDAARPRAARLDAAGAIGPRACAKQLRGDPRTRELPIIMVTARAEEADKVAGLEAWVDDYVTKPFSPRELKARIKSVLRRRAPEAAQEAARRRAR